MCGIKDKLLPLVLIGGGGHAAVLADILQGQNREIAAVISVEECSDRTALAQLPNLFRDEEIVKFSPQEVRLVMGIGILPRSKVRKRLISHFEALGYTFETVVASNAYVSPHATIECGTQVLTNTVVHAGAIVHAHTIVNTGAIVEHDCEIGLGCHIAPNATLCGQVICGNEVFVGAGSVILNNLRLESESIVGAGVTLSRHLKEKEVIRCS
jgi:sugar O-acyltransferase (sialic acid O-acetyltransferase NeuD family)